MLSSEAAPHNNSRQGKRPEKLGSACLCSVWVTNPNLSNLGRGGPHNKFY